MELPTFLILILTALGLAYLYIRKRFSYWSDRGVPFVVPTFPSGSLSGVGFSTTMGEKIAEHYHALKGKGPIGGLFFFITPNVLITDLDLLRNVFIKDFDFFRDRGIYFNTKSDPLSAHLLSIEGEKWRNMRAKLTPTFTSGKMRMMHSTFLIVAQQFNEYLQSKTEEKCEFEMKDLFARFTTDIIGNVAFGLECNSMMNPDNEFRKYGKKHVESTRMESLIKRLILTFPGIAHWLNLRVINPEVSQFFMETIRRMIEYREENKIERNDFLQMLMQIKNTGKLDGETVDLGKLTFNELAAQVFLFFLAGFETSSSTMTFATYELALNQEVQEKARKQIKEVLKKYNGELSYDAAMELTYLDQIIHETLRKYPIAPVLRRKVHAPYKVPGTEVILEKDMIVSIPVLGFHRDPEIYPNPDLFDPERFTKENISTRHPHAWMPFGDGRRNCIGLRFGMMQTRVGLATFINNYKITPSERTPVPIKFQPNTGVLSPVGGMNLMLEKI